uniref:Methuselah N-terminal domain-containing protein n=1 Tax=Stomoxys calcitrans TaxID=35570 RepID=A0A1I8Q503_STOCA
MTHKIGTLFLLLLLLSLCTAGELESKKDLTTLTNVKTENEYIKSSTNQFPENCSQREKCKTQPINTRNSHLRKCCPIGESLSIAHDDQNRAMCVSTSRNVNIKVINVTLYDNCIEDMESELSLPLEIGNPCNTSFLYNDEEDLFLVVQDGSLLVMDPYANDTYSVEKKYCIDVENSSGTTYAIVCITAVEDHINRSQIVIVAILMLISIPCLVLVSYVHFRIKELKSVHGMTLSIMSGCLATGYFLYSLVHIFKLDERGFGYAVQFFILSYYFWFFCLCCNTSFNVCAKCISLLGLILISTWLLEIVTFYSPGPQIYLILMDMVNGVQGVFVLLIFLIIRRRRRIIFRWWSDRGSLVLEKLELEAFN